MIVRVTVALWATALSCAAPAATLEIGAGLAYTNFGSAAAAAQDGDTINVFPGNYTKGAVFAQNNITIQNAPGTKAWSATIKGLVNGKGVLDIQGDGVTIRGLRLIGARAPDGNGAGIRAEGNSILIDGCELYGNEMGVLITPRPGHWGATATIQNSTFSNNGTRRAGYIGHGIYATQNITMFMVTGSRFDHGIIGHYIKSRALTSVISGNTVDDSAGQASYLIDIPQGGAISIDRNTLIKGVNAANPCCAISYGEEMYKGGSYVNPPGLATVTNNSFTNQVHGTVTFVRNTSAPQNPVSLSANTFNAAPGQIIPLSGAGTVQ